MFQGISNNGWETCHKSRKTSSSLKGSLRARRQNSDILDRIIVAKTKCSEYFGPYLETMEIGQFGFIVQFNLSKLLW